MPMKISRKPALKSSCLAERRECFFKVSPYERMLVQYMSLAVRSCTGNSHAAGVENGILEQTGA